MTTASAIRTTPSTTSVRLLARGARGADVYELQTLLKAAGVPTGPIDGDFGSLTQAAVRRFQAAKGLPADGVVGPTTWAALRASKAALVARAQPELRSGDFGADVTRAQQLLQKHGFSTGTADGNFGPNTRAAVVAFQRAKGLSADGVIGGATWQALAGTVSSRPSVPPTVSRPSAPAPAPASKSELGSRMLDAARGELGMRERTGHNDGDILKYPHAFGRGSEAWCADFMSWLSKQSGGRMNDPYCPSVVNSLKRQGTWKTSNPQPGDLVLFDFDHDGTSDHIGIVERINRDGSIATIEGNTIDPETGRQGVFRRDRPRSQVMGFGAPY